MTRILTIAALLAAAALGCLPGGASAAVICGYDAVADRLSIAATDPDDEPGVIRDGSTIYVSTKEGFADCLGTDATVTNTDEIFYESIPAEGTTFTVNLLFGPLAPGDESEGQFGAPEIEIVVKGGDGFDGVHVIGTSGPDKLRAGSGEGGEARVNLNLNDLIPDADIVGTSVEKVVFSGEGGADVLDGRGGAGTEDPFAGYFLPRGGADDDTIDVGAGTSFSRGGEGEDVLHGGGRNDVFLPGPGDDAVEGGDGYDSVGFDTELPGVTVDLAQTATQDTGEGVDTLTGLERATGTAGDDVLSGNAAQNILTGLDGDDELRGRGAGDTLDGGPGVDTVSYAERSEGVAVRLDGLRNDGYDPNGDGFSSASEEADHVLGVENAIGGTGADRFLGTGIAANWFRGGPGGDRLNGGPGSDVLDGGLGIDTISYLGRPGRVAVRLDGLRNDGGDPDGDGFSGPAEENDHALGMENVIGGDGGDRIVATGTVVNVLTGGPGADFLDARDNSAVADTLQCGAGADTHRSDPADAKTACETPG